MDSTVLFGATGLGAAVCVIVAYLLVHRQWWNASGMLALNSAFLVIIVTGGNQSRSEHRVTFAASAILFGYGMIVAAASVRAQRRARG